VTLLLRVFPDLEEEGGKVVDTILKEEDIHESKWSEVRKKQINWL
jgi:hypothetical protein